MSVVSNCTYVMESSSLGRVSVFKKKKKKKIQHRRAPNDHCVINIISSFLLFTARMQTAYCKIIGLWNLRFCYQWHLSFYVLFLQFYNANDFGAWFSRALFTAFVYFISELSYESFLKESKLIFIRPDKNTKICENVKSFQA